VTTLTWDRVAAWRMHRHHLVERLQRRGMLDAVADAGGIQAQMASAAELSIAARVDGVRPDHVRDALWRRRSLVRTWAQRGTIHLLPSREYALWSAGLSLRDHWRKPIYLRNWGLTLEQLDDGIRALGEALSGQPATREELIDAIAAHVSPLMRQRLASGWGELLKPASYLGLLCSGPARGRNVTFVRPSEWLAPWTPFDPDEAMREMARRWLHAYGPGTHNDFATWWGWAPGRASALFRSLGTELERVDVGGWRAWALTSDLEEMTAVPGLEGVVRLVPHFDVYTLGFRPRERLVSEDQAARLFRQAGWISPVVLVDGVAAGVWSYEQAGSRVGVTVERFSRLSRSLRASIESEAHRLGGVLGAEAVVRYAAG
jgi:hypothetical protein